MKFKLLREIKSIWSLRKYLQISEKAYSGIIPFLYESKEEIHKYMQYEVFMTVCKGRIENQRKVIK